MGTAAAAPPSVLTQHQLALLASLSKLLRGAVGREAEGEIGAEWIKLAVQHRGGVFACRTRCVMLQCSASSFILSSSGPNSCFLCKGSYVLQGSKVAEHHCVFFTTWLHGGTWPSTASQGGMGFVLTFQH